jgi:hypothetical protein
MIKGFNLTPHPSRQFSGFLVYLFHRSQATNLFETCFGV